MPFVPMPGAAAAVARIMAGAGETMILKRAGEADLTVTGKRFSLRPENVAGSMDDAAFTIKISNMEIAASAAPMRYPRKGDLIGGFVVLACDTRRVGEAAAVHILTVGGGA